MHKTNILGLTIQRDRAKNQNKSQISPTPFGHHQPYLATSHCLSILFVPLRFPSQRCYACNRHHFYPPFLFRFLYLFFFHIKSPFLNLFSQKCEKKNIQKVFETMSCSSPMRKTSCLSRRFSRSLRLSAKTAALTTRENQLESSSVSSPSSSPPSAEEGGDSWSTLLPELLVEIMERVEASEEMWPDRKNVVSSACVCKKWREVTREIVKASSQNSGKITFPSCLKQVIYLFILKLKLRYNFVI